MKKYFILAAACVALVSCVKNESAEPATPSSDQKITFETPLVQPGTRALIDNTTYPADESFTVLGLWYKGGKYSSFANGDVYMGSKTDAGVYSGVVANPVKVDNVTKYWATSTDYYWPKQGYLTFQAYSPSSLDCATFTASGVEFTDYTITANHDVDILFSERSYNRNASINLPGSTIPGSYNGVDILFKHALSSIKVNAVYTKEDADDAARIVLKYIKLADLYSKGSYDQSLEDADGKTTPATAPNYWTNDNTTQATYDILASDKANYQLTETSTLVSETSVIVLPQAFTAGQQKIEINYDLNDKNMTTTVDLSTLTYNSTDGGSAPATGFEVGKQYTFNITVGPKKIYFAPYVENWKGVVGFGTTSGDDNIIEI